MQLLVEENYSQILNMFAKNLAHLSKNEKNLLKNLLLFCAIDFLTTLHDRPNQHPFNPFFKRNNQLHLIKQALDADEDYFYYLYDHINDIAFVQKKLKEFSPYFSSIKLPIQQKKNHIQETHIKELKKNGITIFKQFFLKADIENYKKNAFELLNSNEPSIKKHFYENEGRKRIWLNPENASSIFKNLMQNNTITSYISSFYQCEVKCESMQIEHLTQPQIYSNFQYWHVDNLADQIKVFIPLLPVYEDSGPLHYIEGSHHYSSLDPLMKNYIHYIYTMSDLNTRPTNGIPRALIHALKQPIKKALATQGDLVFFNSSFLHAGSHCINQGERLNLVLIFNTLETNKNILFKNFHSYYGF